ncbi:MAG: general secretion pathway protein GspK [Phycisphaerae bacterium]|nr:general secretion pathway protein GspK [Phycisphaerae bacterium]
MHPHHRGFALILVLLAAASVFALTLQAAMIARAATIESRVLSDRAEQERNARSAAVIVLTGLGTTVERFAAQTSSTSTPPARGGAGQAPGGGEDERPRIELPEMLKQMLGEQAKELEKEARDSLGDGRLTDGGGITGRIDRARSRLTIKNLPGEPVSLRLTETGPEYRVTVIDSAALLNVNAADRDQLVRYFTAKSIESEVASALASQIVDWRDEDDFANPGGAEQAAYRERGIVCRNGAMQAIDELRFLPAMTSEIFDLVRGDLTVAGDAKVHAQTAPRAVLRSLPGMDDGAVRTLIEARQSAMLEPKDLDRILPIYAREAKDFLKFDLTGVLRLRVEVAGDTRTVFEGLAVLGDKGIRGVGLRPLL